jgi:C1A family cysteine protease
MSKIIIAIALLALVSVASATRAESITHLWSAWKTAHKKHYSATEEAHRLAVFIHNVEKIAKLNAQNSGAKFGVNQFADLTSSEFKSKYATGSFFEEPATDKIVKKTITATLPDNVDWRSQGAVTPVKDQGQCGSCWAFSTTGVLESFYFINNGKLLSFSEQQIVDCAKTAGSGCSGGWPYKAVDYAAQYGLEQEGDYPYTAKDGTCKFTASKAVKITSGYKAVTPKSSDQLKAALVDTPVSVAIQADQSVFQFYKSGVISTGCGASVNHAVLAVGYQKVGVLEAFIVKNSWGTSWGNSGYVYISTIQQLNNGYGACGILYMPVYAAI